MIKVEVWSIARLSELSHGQPLIMACGHRLSKGDANKPAHHTIGTTYNVMSFYFDCLQGRLLPSHVQADHVTNQSRRICQGDQERGQPGVMSRPLLNPYYFIELLTK